MTYKKVFPKSFYTYQILISLKKRNPMRFMFIMFLMLASLAYADYPCTSQPCNLTSDGKIPSTYGFHQLRFISNNSLGHSVDANEDGVIDVAEVALNSIGGLWSQNGADIYFNGGNVGIGTDVPDRSLVLKRASDSIVRIESASANYAAIDFNSTDVQWGVGRDNQGSFYIDQAGRQQILVADDQIQTAAEPRIFIDEDGRVGIRNNNPSADLDISGSMVAGDPSTYWNFSTRQVISGLPVNFPYLSAMGGIGTKPMGAVERGFFYFDPDEGSNTLYQFFMASRSPLRLWGISADVNSTEGNFSISQSSIPLGWIVLNANTDVDKNLSVGENIEVLGNIDIAAGSDVCIQGGNCLSTAGGGAGGNTLDQAYDQGGQGLGRTITADSGAVVIENMGNNAELDIQALPSDYSAINFMDIFGSISWGIGRDSQNNLYIDQEGMQHVLVAEDTAVQDTTPRIFVDSSGKVGVNNSNPLTQLDVKGKIHASGDICTDENGGNCLSSTTSLPSCQNGQMTRWNGIAWECVFVNPSVTGSSAFQVATCNSWECSGGSIYGGCLDGKGVCTIQGKQIFFVKSSENCDGGSIQTGTTPEGYKACAIEPGVLYEIDNCISSNCINSYYVGCSPADNGICWVEPPEPVREIIYGTIYEVASCSSTHCLGNQYIGCSGYSTGLCMIGSGALFEIDTCNQNHCWGGSTYGGCSPYSTGICSVPSGTIYTVNLCQESRCTDYGNIYVGCHDGNAVCWMP